MFLASSAADQSATNVETATADEQKSVFMKARVHGSFASPRINSNPEDLQINSSLPNISVERKRYLPEDLKRHSTAHLQTSHGHNRKR